MSGNKIDALTKENSELRKKVENLEGVLKKLTDSHQTVIQEKCIPPWLRRNK